MLPSSALFTVDFLPFIFKEQQFKKVFKSSPFLQPFCEYFQCKPANNLFVCLKTLTVSLLSDSPSRCNNDTASFTPSFHQHSNPLSHSPCKQANLQNTNILILTYNCMSLSLYEASLNVTVIWHPPLDAEFSYSFCQHAYSFFLLINQLD